MATSSSHKIFIDSSFFFSFIDRADLNHQKTVDVFDFLGRQNYQLYTSSLVVYQTFSRVERDLGSGVSYDFLQAILDSAIKLLYTTESELLFAFRFFKNSPQRQVSILEVISARIMERQGIVAILTYDYWHNISGTYVSELIK